ncbi:MAG: 16S rRNA (cytosine(967)-C(5))-methyltransferase RsmB [Eubacteriales bacterium]|nr:16S rRNA (cytosine(967)-C(5))-methyltransferase RsmB [Eubacteriales bacterium]
MTEIHTAREAAARALFAIREEDAWSAPAIRKYAAGLSVRDAALATALTDGVLQNRSMCDFYLAHFSKIRLKKLQPRILDILRLAVYQMVWLDRIPNAAAVDESVKLARSICHANRQTCGYVNGLLRTIARNMDQLPVPNCETKVEYYALQYSHPQWLVELYLEQFGLQQTRLLLEADNQPAPTVLRVNTLCATAEQVQQELESQGVVVQVHAAIPNCLLVSGAGKMEALPAFAQGRVTVQDGASQMSVYALDPKPGDRVLDCCAAPGGKSFFAAERMEGTGTVVSCDVYEYKLKQIQEGAARLGLTNIRTELQDASVFRPEWEGKFDRVLCDVPCSGMGIIRKKPEIRYKAEESLRSLPDIQLAILRNASRYVKEGGTLVYSTCTLLRRENEEIVDSFLQGQDYFKKMPFSLPVCEQPSDGCVTLLPYIHDTDGFFVAKFCKMAYYGSNDKCGTASASQISALPAGN